MNLANLQIDINFNSWLYRLILWSQKSNFRRQHFTRKSRAPPRTPKYSPKVLFYIDIDWLKKSATNNPGILRLEFEVDKMLVVKLQAFEIRLFRAQNWVEKLNLSWTPENHMILTPLAPFPSHHQTFPKTLVTVDQRAIESHMYTYSNAHSIMLKASLVVKLQAFEIRLFRAQNWVESSISAGHLKSIWFWRL